MGKVSLSKTMRIKCFSGSMEVLPRTLVYDSNIIFVIVLNKKAGNKYRPAYLQNIFLTSSSFSFRSIEAYSEFLNSPLHWYRLA
jgi:hypothetical protein